MNKSQPRSIAEHIACLARLTGAPDTFVLEVRELFATKGIPLESDATPYLSALEDAFLREERNRSRAPLLHARTEATVLVRAEHDTLPFVPGPEALQ